MARILLSLAMCFAILTLSFSAAGNERAQELFYEGRTLLEQGAHAAACAKFKESLALHARANTYFNLARCHRQQGMLLEAREYWRAGQGMVPPDDERAVAAVGEIAKLDRAIPTLRVTVDLDVGDSTRLDGRVLKANEINTKVPVNPGEHVVVLERAAGAEERRPVSVKEGEDKDVRFEAVVSPFGPEPTTPQPVVPVADDGLGGLQIAGISLLAFGGVAAIVAAATGGAVLHNQSIVDANCEDLRCNQEGAEAAATGHALLIPNVVAWAVGGAALAAGTILLIVGSSADGDSVGVRVSPTGLAIEGTF